MENEIAAIRSLISEGVSVLALTLALLAPLGLSISAMGSGRFRNRYANLGWMVLLFPFGFLTAYLVGWMFSFSFASGPVFTGGFRSAWHAVPWGDVLGPGFQLTDNGAFRSDNQDFIRFIAIGWLASTILAFAVLERIKLGGLLLLATLLTGFCLALAIGWGWSADGWMVVLMGYHDPTGIATTATLAGGFSLAVLRVLGPRIASLDDKAQPHRIEPNSPGLVLTGNLLVFFGFIGLCLAAVNFASPVQFGDVLEYVSTNVYGAPVDPAGMMLNFIAAIAGGLLIGTILTQGDIGKTVTITLAGVVGAAPMVDFFNPLQTVLLAMFITWASSGARSWLERKFNLDDVGGSVALFGFAGFWGLVISGVFLWGIPVTVNPDHVHINPFGNTTAAMILFWALGFIPGYIAARIVRFSGGLRLEEMTELVGRDLNMLREAEGNSIAAFKREDQFVREKFEGRS